MKYIRPESLQFDIMSYPYPHIVIDNFLKDDYIESILKELSEITIDKPHYKGNNVYETNKYAFSTGFNQVLTEIFTELNCDEFINVLETKLGIPDIIRNNLELRGAGVHKVFDKGLLCMHTDFEGYKDDTHGHLDRRINLLLYMNPDWKPEYGGNLCLYDNKTMHKIVKRIEPILNRCVIFLTTGNIHGHPKPMNLPDNICRQSITTYYYTKNKNGERLVDGDKYIPVMWYKSIEDNA